MPPRPAARQDGIDDAPGAIHSRAAQPLLELLPGKRNVRRRESPERRELGAFRRAQATPQFCSTV
ncbi:MAG TPA: hypothetical protein VNJ70_19505 [Thermoanaerobaculia bacterium]|nr:hypothetical protein [Thermoanaerobaculia bacterium]